MVVYDEWHFLVVIVKNRSSQELSLIPTCFGAVNVLSPVKRAVRYWKHPWQHFLGSSTSFQQLPSVYHSIRGGIRRLLEGPSSVNATIDILPSQGQENLALHRSRHFFYHIVYHIMYLESAMFPAMFSVRTVVIYFLESVFIDRPPPFIFRLRHV